MLIGKCIFFNAERDCDAGPHSRCSHVPSLCGVRAHFFFPPAVMFVVASWAVATSESKLTLLYVSSPST